MAAVEVPIAWWILKLIKVTIVGTIMVPPPIPMRPHMKPSGKPKMRKGRALVSGFLVGFASSIVILTAAMRIIKPKIVLSTDAGTWAARVPPKKAPNIPEMPRSKAAFSTMTPLRRCPMAPFIAVGRAAARAVPKDIRIAIVGSTFIVVRTQNWTGTMMKHPPTPSIPEAKPATDPVISSIAT